MSILCPEPYLTQGCHGCPNHLPKDECKLNRGMVDVTNYDLGFTTPKIHHFTFKGDFNE